MYRFVDYFRCDILEFLMAANESVDTKVNASKRFDFADGEYLTLHYDAVKDVFAVEMTWNNKIHYDEFGSIRQLMTDINHFIYNSTENCLGVA